LIDGPKDGASRQVIALTHLDLLHVVLPKFPRGARSGTVAKKWASAEVEKKFETTRHSRKMVVREKRNGLSDFERFVVARLKKQVQPPIRLQGTSSPWFGDMKLTLCSGDLRLRRPLGRRVRRRFVAVSVFA
jgi:ribosomal protein L14E/L6E/L27E